MARNKKAESKFADRTKSNPTFRETIEQERAARESKNTRLRAMRLAQEARDKEEALANPPVKASSPKRKTKVPAKG